MKKYVVVFFAVAFAMSFSLVPARGEALDREMLKEKLEHHGGVLGGIGDHIHLGGLIEVGGVWQDIDYKKGHAPESEDESDLALTTVELELEAEVNEWVNVTTLFLFEDPSFGEETHLEVDEGVLTIGNLDVCPFYFSAGKMYVPFGALLTHFPDDPLVEAPLTLLLGETVEKAVLVGFEDQVFSLSGYLFNGDVDEQGEDNRIDSYGLDANYSSDDVGGFEVLVGASYISNIADSDGLEEAIHEAVGSNQVEDYVEAFAVYLEIAACGAFFDTEYMTALDDFAADELAHDHGKAEPSVWNFEVGYVIPELKDLEVVLKYAGSDEAEALEFPEDRYGFCFNQTVFEDITASLGYYHDEYDDQHKDEGDVFFGQLAVEF